MAAHTSTSNGEKSEEEERQRLYDKTREELLAQQLSNSQTYDNAILSLSSAFLALSIVFMKDILKGATPICLYVLYASWIFFCAAIVVTILSFIHGQWVIKKLMDKAREYYIDRKEDARKYSRQVSVRVDWINRIAGLLFALAVLSTLLFAIENFSRPTPMAKDREPVPTKEWLKKSQPTNTFQEVKPVQKPATGGDSGQSQVAPVAPKKDK
jgi:hypothetical protein